MKTRFFGTRLEEEFIMDNSELTRLLFIRKELDAPVTNKNGNSRKSPLKPGAKSQMRTIESSPLYESARARVYASTPAPNASTSTAPQAAVGDHPPILASLSPSLLNTPVQSRQGSVDYARSVIEISDSDVEVEHAESGSPVIVVAWTEVRSYLDIPKPSLMHFYAKSQDNSRYIETLVVSGDDHCFSLADYKLELGAKGVEYGSSKLEVYNPKIKEWVPLKWSDRIGPIRKLPFTVYLIRYKGVEVLDRFEVLQCMATSGGLPDPKGKRRAT